MSTPLYQPAGGTVNASGAVVMAFQSPGQGYTWTGTVNVPNATGNETWTVSVGNALSGSPWGTFLGNSPWGPVQASEGQTVTITATGLTPGKTYNAVLIGQIDPSGQAPIAMPLPQPLTLAQISGAINAAVSGTVNAAAAEFAFTNSPWNPNAVNVSQTFTFPANSPAITGVAVTYWANPGGNAAAQIVITGLTTGNTYLSLIADHGQWVFPFSNLIEPAGLKVTLNQVNGDTAAKSNELSVVGLTSPEFVRTLAGPGIAGPDSSNRLAMAPNGSVAIAGTGSRTNVIRVWNVSIVASGETAGIGGSATLFFGLTTFLGCRVKGQGNNTVSHQFPTGLPLQLFFNPLTAACDANTAAEFFIAYSTDCA